MSDSSKAFNIYKFLKDYSELPCLWKKNCPEFKNRHERDAAEEQLLSRTNFSSKKELRTKIRSIRGTYNHEKSKVKKSMLTAAGMDKVYRPRLKWYELADSFLKENEEENEEHSNLKPKNYEDLCSSLLEEYSSLQPMCTLASATHNVVISCSSDNSEGHEPSAQELQQETIHVDKDTKTSASVKKRKFDSPIDNAASTLKRITKRVSTTPNEFIIFGNHVASQLQSLPLEEAIKVEEKIQSLLTSTRLRCIHNKRVHKEDPAIHDDHEYVFRSC